MPVWRVLPLAEGDDPQKGVRVIRQAWNGDPFLSGVIADVGVTSSGEFTIHHRLGRKPNGFVVEWVERASGATNSCSIYYRDGATRDATSLVLYATGSFNAARIRVF